MLKDKVAIVTGSGTGIGKAIATRLASENARVVIADIDQAAGQQTVETIRRCDGAAMFAQVDVSKSDDVKHMVNVAIDEYGRLDILVNNAGIAVANDNIVDLSTEDWDRVMAVNLKGVYLGCKFAFAPMSRQGGGSMINISSTAGLMANRNLASYCASKSGVVGLTRATALDCARHNIRVNCICPGTIVTATTEKLWKLRATKLGWDPQSYQEAATQAYPLGRLGKPEDVANLALFLASDDASFITGAIVTVDGGVTAQGVGFTSQFSRVDHPSRKLVKWSF